MRSFAIADNRLLPPFNEPARSLTVIGVDRIPTPLKIHQKEVTARALGPCPVEEDLEDIYDLKNKLEMPREGVDPQDEIFVYRDNIYFDREFLEYFLKRARDSGRPCQLALPDDDPAWNRYVVPLSSLHPVMMKDGKTYYPAEMWYFPNGWAEREQWSLLAVPSGWSERGYYNIPDSMTNVKYSSDGKPMARDQDLTHYQSRRTCVLIESWVHIFNATVPLGVFSLGARVEDRIRNHNLFALRLLFQAVLEQKQIRSSSSMVKVGARTEIDPSAVILGPTTIGENCKIGPGVVIDNCVIGNNVTIAQGCQLMLSIVGHNSFMPFRSALFMTLIMENTIVAQNTCLQMCVVGRNSFVGAGTTFTDFNLLPSPLRAPNYAGVMEDIRQPVMGGCVGHNCRLGAGLVIYPARMIESDVILVAAPDRRVVMKEISYEMSDHHRFAPRVAMLHKRQYQREGIEEVESW